MPEERLHESYIGDGAYVYLTATYDVVLYTSDGCTETNRVYLEPDVLTSFVNWLERVRKKVEQNG